MDIMDWMLIIGIIGIIAFLFGGLDQWLLSPEKRAERRAKKLFREFLKNIAEYKGHATWHVLKTGAKETDENPWMLHAQDVFTYTGKSSRKFHFEIEEGVEGRQLQIFFVEDNLAPSHVTAYFEWDTKVGTYLQLADTKSYESFMNSLTLTAGGVQIKFQKIE